MLTFSSSSSLWNCTSLSFIFVADNFPFIWAYLLGILAVAGLGAPPTFIYELSFDSIAFNFWLRSFIARFSFLISSISSLKCFYKSAGRVLRPARPSVCFLFLMSSSIRLNLVFIFKISDSNKFPLDLRIVFSLSRLYNLSFYSGLYLDLIVSNGFFTSSVNFTRLSFMGFISSGSSFLAPETNANTAFYSYVDI